MTTATRSKAKATFLDDVERLAVQLMVAGYGRSPGGYTERTPEAMALLAFDAAETYCKIRNERRRVWFEETLRAQRAAYEEQKPAPPR